MIPWSNVLCSGGSRFTGGGDGDVTPRSSSACDPGTAVSTATNTFVKTVFCLLNRCITASVIVRCVGSDATIVNYK
jgi:hypothetical protein